MSKKTLGLFQLVMINVIAVDSIRTLTFSAVYGFSLVFFYLLAALFFFLPTAFVSAELGTGWPTRGGIYVWVREAFGKKWSLIVIWLNWIYNIIWYPTIMALIAGTFAYLFNPALASNKFYMCGAILVLFWAATFLNCFGMRISSWISTIGAIVGTIFPMLLIALLGIIWVWKNNPLQIDLSWSALLPAGSQTTNLAFLTNVLFGLLGLEMAATHAAEMRNPIRDYPRSLFISAGIILATIILASLAIAIVVPTKELSLATGVMQAFTAFADAYGLFWLSPLMAGCIILGGLSGVSAWIIGPTKGLLVASQDGSLPPFLRYTNKKDVPVRILVLQALIVSVLSLLFILMPTVNSSYWILSVITAQVALLVYIFLFAAAIKLKKHKAHVQRPFRVPGGKWGLSLISGLGITSCLVVICFGFWPPGDIQIQSIFSYELFLILGIGVCCAIPFFIISKKR